MATPIPKNRARFTVAEVVSAVSGQLRSGEPDRQLEGVAIDSRAAEAGGLFVAIRGEQQDGAAYLPGAVARGVAAVLVHPGTPVPDGVAAIEVPDTTYALGELARFHRRRWGRRVVAITGSAGKTTTKELTAGAFRGAGFRVLKTEGNLNNQFGVPMTILCLSSEHELAVLELGTSGRGEIARLGAIAEPDVAVVLLAAVAHTQGLGTLDDVATEKSSLFSALGSKGVAVVNGDDDKLLERRRRDVKTLSFGTRPGVDVRLVSSALDVGGTRATLSVLGEAADLSLRLMGHAAALDAGAALASVVALEGPSALAAASAGMATVEPTKGRMAVRTTAAGIHLIDDTYNANPSSVALGLETLRELARAQGGRSIAVLADMKELGPLSQEEHARAGEQAVRLGIDVLIGAGPEMAHASAAAARLSAGRLAPHPTRVVHVFDPLEAAAIVRSLWRAGDVVLVKGSRSMAMERVFEALARNAEGGSP